MTITTAPGFTHALPATLPFWKMHGTGNDFVVAESDDADAPWGALAERVCDRHFGVGADGLILVLPSQVADRRMRMFNPDGSEAEMCGNGIRCFVKYAIERGLVSATAHTMTVETVPGVLRCEATRDEHGRVTRVRASMGVPALAPAALGVQIEQAPPVLDLPLDADGETRHLTLVSMGNPHAVALIDVAPGDYPVTTVGPVIEHHPLFANRTNVEFVRVLSRDHVEMRVWERGAGETLACGTGACAAMVASRLHGLVDDRVDVTLPGGTLTIEWDGRGEVYLSGAVTFVFDAIWDDTTHATARSAGAA